MPPAAELSTFYLGGDPTINRIGFGAMQLSSQAFYGPARDPETGRQVLRRAIELGVNHIDTQLLPKQRSFGPGKRSD
jgi:aryl-alcohol dehydrogenase-like predicted oxidoreductase